MSQTANPVQNDNKRILPTFGQKRKFNANPAWMNKEKDDSEKKDQEDKKLLKDKTIINEGTKKNDLDKKTKFENESDDEGEDETRFSNAYGSIIVFNGPDYITGNESTNKKIKRIKVIKDGSIAAKLISERPVNLIQNISTNDITQICPKCGQAIPMNELLEHVRIELLDPRGKEQKERAMTKNRGTNLETDGNLVVDRLDKMAALRPDIFGGDVLEAENKAKEAIEIAQRTVQWDGHAAGRATARKQRDDITGGFTERKEQERLQEKELQQRQNMIGPRIIPRQ